MLAYVFWHWPSRPKAKAAAYEDALCRFQQRLETHARNTLAAVYVFRHGAAPWMGKAGAGYVDWYLMAGSKDLDSLNETAVNTFMRAAHDEVANLASGGAAGLYRAHLSLPPARLALARHSQWFNKPSGMSYPDFDDAIKDMAREQGRFLWQRQMVLGPTPEYCLLSDTPVTLPGESGSSILASPELECIWQPSR